jgi:hypothetical protein
LAQTVQNQQQGDDQQNCPHKIGRVRKPVKECLQITGCGHYTAMPEIILGIMNTWKNGVSSDGINYDLSNHNE